MEEQIAQIKSNSNAFASASIRGVQGGFVVAGQMQYQDKATKGIVLTENAEGVSSSPEQATQMCLNYLRSGTFDGTPVSQTVQTDTSQANMFAPATI